MQKVIASKAEKGCLQELCKARYSIWQRSMIPERL